MGEDEAAERCCDVDSLNLEDDQYAYRCVIGRLSAHYTPVITDQCINSKAVCDWNSIGSNATANCDNGADELDCVHIWPGALSLGSENRRDPFGRYLTNHEGYVYFVAFGRKYLYCAGKHTWTVEHRQDYGRIICKNEGFGDLVRISLHDPPGGRTRIGLGQIILVPLEETNYQECQLVYITCHLKVKH